jgi:hypothetical protein
MNRDIAIKTAAKWWTDKLRKQQPHDNGDRSSWLAMRLIDMVTKPVSENQLNRFQKALEEIIDQNLNLKEYGFGLHCDYGPDHMLFGAARQANIDANNFPYKPEW